MSAEISVTVRRAVIETNLESCRNRAAESYVEMGRWLLAAKEENVVPHGEWEDWVMQHAAMSVRGAQRCMQIAREIPAGSPLAALGKAKLRALLELPAGEREDAAEQMEAEKISAREVDARVKAMRAERDEALRLVGEQKKRLREMDNAAKEAQAREDAAVELARTQARAQSAREIERQKSLADSAFVGQKRTEKLLTEAREQADRLRQELERERTRSTQGDPAQEAAIQALRRKVEAQEEEIDRLSDALDEAQTMAMRTGMADAPRSPTTVILSAIGALMTEAGRAPAELARTQGLDHESRALLCGQARLVGQWAMQVLAACGEAGDRDA